MKRGGLFLVEVPNHDSVRARRDATRWRYRDPSHHVAQYTPAAPHARFQRVSLDHLEIVTVPWGV